MHFNYP
jgi:hypothetical protein